MKRLRVQLRTPTYSYVRVADKFPHRVEGSASLPLIIGEYHITWDFLVVPTLEHSLILGIDFLPRSHHSQGTLEPKIKEVMHHGLDEYLSMGVVEPSTSPWRSSVLVLRKKDASYRWVVDLRGVNKVSKPDAYPMPKVQEILDELRNAKYLSSIDLKSAFFQIPLDEESKEKTAFVVPGRGLYQFTRMPQGLNSSP